MDPYWNANLREENTEDKNIGNIKEGIEYVQIQALYILKTNIKRMVRSISSCILASPFVWTLFCANSQNSWHPQKS